MNSLIAERIILTLVATLLLIASANAQTCQLSIDGNTNLGQIIMLQSSQVSEDNELICDCSDRVDSIEFILPNGEVAVNDSAHDVVIFPGSISISPRSGDLAEGIYTCRVNNQDELHAYILDNAGLSQTVSNTQCRVSSLSPLELVLSSQVTGIAPETFTCLENGSPIAIDPQISIADRNRPTTTLISIPFSPSTTMGSLACTVTSPNGVQVDLNCMYSTSSLPSRPPTPSLADSPQIGVGTIASPSFPQITISSLSDSSPLWCQGSDSNDEVTWITPGGEEINAGSISPLFGIIEDEGALGIFPTPPAAFPVGIYTCRVNGQSTFAQVNPSPSIAPVQIDSQNCQLEENPLRLTASARTSGSLPSGISCSPSAAGTSISPFMSTFPAEFDISATFNPATAGQTYTCEVTSPVESNPSFTCNVLAIPSDFTAVRDTTDPSTVTFTWQQPPTISQIEGYTIRIFSPNGTLVDTVTVLSPSTTSVDVTGLDPDQELLAVISSSSNSPTAVAPTSDPISIPTADESAEPCRPAVGRMIDICLRRPLRDGENSSSCDCSDGFGEAAFESFVQSTCINSTECSSAKVSHEPDNCKCKPSKKEKTMKTSGKRRKEKSEKTPGKKGMKEKSAKKEKTTKKEKTPDEEFIEMCLKGTLLCGSCDPVEESRRRREVPKRKLRFRRRHSGQMESSPMEKSSMEKSPMKKGQTEKSPKATLINNCPDVLSIQGTDYSITGKIKLGRRHTFFCGEMQVEETDTCDCPASCG